MLRHVQPLERQAQGERQPQRQRLERQLVVRRCSQLTSFLSLLLGRVLFCKLTIPSAEHFPDLIKHHSDYQVGSQVDQPDAIIVRSAKVDTDQYSELIAIARAGAGVNNISVTKATEKGVCVFNTPGANANAVAELVFIMPGV